MNPNPFTSLLHSRKFLTLILDVVISTATYFITKYAAPDVGKDVLWLIGSWQPVFVMLIGSIAAEDNAARRAEALTARTAPTNPTPTSAPLP